MESYMARDALQLGETVIYSARHAFAKCECKCDLASGRPMQRVGTEWSKNGCCTQIDSQISIGAAICLDLVIEDAHLLFLLNYVRPRWASAGAVGRINN